MQSTFTRDRQSHFYPANTMLEREVDRKHFLQTQQTTIECECFTNLGMI